MASLTLILPSFALSSSSTRLPLRKPCAPPFTALFKLKPLPSQNPSNRRGRRRRRRIKNGTCRAEFSHDAPFAAAIGACVLTSLVFAASTREGDESDAVMDSTDTRFAVMGIVSFIPYFNWLSWVFAWLDTGKRRYAVYSLVYLAPYLRSNLSLSPEESWLPIASIVLCILHVQLEASIRNGDIHGFQLFSEAAKLLSLEKHRSLESEMKHMNLPSSETRAGKDIWHGDVPGRPSRDQEHATGGDWDDDDDDDDEIA